MKRLPILIAILFSLSVEAQEAGILIGVNFSPDYSYRTLKNLDRSNTAGLTVQSRDKIEIAKFGYTSGVQIFINVASQLGFETGIQYSNKGYKTTRRDLLFIPPNPAAPTAVRFVYSYHYLGIPLLAKFVIGKKKVRFLPAAGFMTSLLLNAKQTSNYSYASGKSEKQTQSIHTNFNKIDISPTISVGLRYRINNKTYLGAEPTFRYGMIKTKDGPVGENLWCGGMNVGIYYGVK